MGAGESSEAAPYGYGDIDSTKVDPAYASRIRAAHKPIPVHDTRPVHRIVDSHEHYVRVLIWDPYHDVLVSGGGDGWIRLWSIHSWAQVAEMDAKLSVRSLLVMSQELASGHSNGEVLLWGMEDSSHSLVQRIQAHREAVYALAYLPSGDLVTGAEDIRVFSKGMLGMFTGFQHSLTISEEVLCMCTIPGSTQVVTGNMNSLILVWESAEEWVVKAECHGHQRSVWAVCFLPDARRCCSGSADHSIRVWHPRTWECERVLKDHTGWVVGLSVGVGALLSCSIDQGIRVWNSKTWACERTFTDQDYEVYCVCAFAGGRFATGGAEMAILIYGGPEHASTTAPPGRDFNGMISESPGGASRRRGRQQARGEDYGFGIDEHGAYRSYPSQVDFPAARGGGDERTRNYPGQADFPPVRGGDGDEYRSYNAAVNFAPGSGHDGPQREGHQQRRAQLMAASELDITMSDFRRQLVEVEKTRKSNRSRREQQVTKANYPEQSATTAKFGTPSPPSSARRRQPSPKPPSKADLPPEDDILTFETVRAVPTAQDAGLQPEIAQGSDGVTEWSSVLRSSRQMDSNLRGLV